MFIQFRQAVVDFVRQEDGPTAVEYAVMMSLIIVACILSVTALGTNTAKVHTKVSNTLATSS